MSGSIVHGLNILVVMFSYPLYINFLGFELFSVWVLLSVVIAFAKMGELGISKAIISFVARENANNNHIEIRRIVSNSIYIIIIPSILIFLALWMLKGNIVKFLNIPDVHITIAIQVIPFIGIAIVSYLIYDIFSGVISGLGRLDISNALLLFLNITKVVISIIFLLFGYTLFALIYGILVSNALFILIKIILITIKFKIPLHKLKKPHKNNIKQLLNFGLSIIGMQVFNMLSFPFIKIVLSNTIGIDAVGIFELATKAGYAVRTLFEKGLFALMPEISYLSKKHNNLNESKAVVYEKVMKFSKYLVYFAVPFFILLSISAPLWLKLWLGINYNKSILMGYLLLQPGIIAGLLALPSFYALMATDNQIKCFIESVIRALIIFALFALFFFYRISIYEAFIFLSISVIISNLYIITTFRMKYRF